MDTVIPEAKAKRRRRDAGDTRAERKRELDRLAQRATRERTKNRIADLEQRLASLESGDKNGEIAQLTRTIGDLRSENGRYQNALVKMRFAINEALSVVEGSVRRDSTSTNSHYENGTRHNSTTGMASEPRPVDEEYDGIVTSTNHMPLSTQEQRLQALFTIHGYSPPTPEEFSSVELESVFEFFGYAGDNSYLHPSPLNLRMSGPDGYLPIAPDELKWKTSDDAFHQSLTMTRQYDTNLDESILAKAILLGWESIGPLATHPLFIALRCVDQRVFGKWTSRPQRLATMYLCGASLQWRARPTEENKNKIPPWFLPRPAQEKIQHPLVIDFLVWPGMRERLVFEYEKYTQTGQFSYCFVEYFHFNWPFPDEQVAEYDPTTGLICRLSKLFKDYVFDLKNWTMMPEFFVTFPEMKADVDVYIPQNIQYQKGGWT